MTNVQKKKKVDNKNMIKKYTKKHFAWEKEEAYDLQSS